MSVRMSGWPGVPMARTIVFVFVLLPVTVCTVQCSSASYAPAGSPAQLCAEANQQCAQQCRPVYAGPRESIYRGQHPSTPSSSIACEARCAKSYQLCMERPNQRTL